MNGMKSLCSVQIFSVIQKDKGVDLTLMNFHGAIVT